MFRFAVRVLALVSLASAVATSADAQAWVHIDVPAANAVVPSSFIMGGWALDLSSKYDTGISVVDVWVYPSSGIPVFVGEITHGARPDVAAAFGPQFGQAGMSILVRNLPPDRYTFVLTPWSTITHGFQYDRAVVVPVVVSASAPVIPMPPAPGAPAPQPASPSPTPSPEPQTPSPQPTTPAPAPSTPSSPGSGSELRVLQWNVHHGGYGTDGVYSPDRIATWAAQMRPDVVTFNEIERNDYWGHQDQPEVYKALLEQKTGKTWYYVFAQEFGNWGGSGKGNLILSSFPIQASDRYELVQNNDRSVAMATIVVGGRDITILSTHLDPYDQSLRLAQATEVTNWAAAQPENRILTGDMNAWPDQSSIAQLDRFYSDAWAVAVQNGTATAFAGNSGETKSGRIDYIFASKRAANLSVKASQVVDTRDANGVEPSDHRPVLATFIVN